MTGAISSAKRPARWAAEACRARGIAFVDLTAPFRALEPGELAQHHRVDHHYSELGNELVAATLLEHLRELVPGFPGPPD